MYFWLGKSLWEGPAAGRAPCPRLGLGCVIAFGLEGAAEERRRPCGLSRASEHGPASRRWQGGRNSGSSLTDGRRDPLPRDTAGDFSSGASALGVFLLLLYFWA